MGSGINFKQLARTKFTRDDHGAIATAAPDCLSKKLEMRFGSPIKTSHRPDSDVLSLLYRRYRLYCSSGQLPGILESILFAKRALS